MTLFPEIGRIAAVGIVATVVLDLWLLLLQTLGVPTLDFALIGRWAGHWPRGRFRHEAIARAAAVPGERALGWFVHYLTGVAFAALLVAIRGSGWLHDPTLVPALAIGMGPVLAPWLLMQPAMGAGLAASRTPRPGVNRLRSLVNHTVFGAGLYVAASAITALGR